MKKVFLLSALFLLASGFLKAQNKNPNRQDSLNEILGSYKFEAEICLIRKHNEKLLVDFGSQGKTTLTALTQNRFRVDRVNPEAIIEIVKDSLKKVYKFRWIQDVGTLKWNRIDDRTSSHSKGEQKGTGGMFQGRYRLENRSRELIVKEEGGQITAQATGEGTLKLSPITTNQLVFKSGDLQLFLNFQKKRKGKFQEILQTRTGSLEFVKLHEEDSNVSLISHTSNRHNGFTRADTLRGMLTPVRDCYDVLFYNLDVTIDPDSRIIKGSNTIRFRAIDDFDRMQIDLFANMKIEHILYQNLEFPYKREFNAVFIQFPHKIKKGSVEEVKIIYAGKPQIADVSTMTGGFIWYQDKNGKPWIESVCQGVGASLWWPCKDHLSDKPDSMKISVTVPQGLTDISNGKLLAKTELPGNLTRFDWYVSYPIVNYNVVVNIGDYIHFSDQYVNEQDTLALNYYCLSYNRNKAKQVFKNVKPMLVHYEKLFGKYPFKKDGFTAMESLYPMEHQSAISIGSIYNPVHSNKFDLKELIRTMWHEAAHEWWGNNITCRDMADLWIHESFATYTETLNYEVFNDKKTALKHLRTHPPQNKESIIGVYDVNHFHLGDMYSKGALMLHTLRSIIAKDSLFFDMLKGLQDSFRYQSVNTEMVVSYINEKTKKDYTAFFNQYLRYGNIPELELKFIKESTDMWSVQYRWNAQAKGFAMPVKITKSKNEWAVIYPTADWQQLDMRDIRQEDFKVDTENFYIKVKKE